MKKQYIQPKMIVVEMDATNVICGSNDVYRVSLPAGAPSDVDEVAFESASYRSTLWD